MTRPIASHIINRNHVSPGKNTIMKRQVPIPKIGTSGTSGVLNALGASGIFTRMIQTPIHTSMNANSVPMLVISPTTLAGTNAANKLTNTMNSRLDFAGVLNLECTEENTGGNNPSLLMLKNTLDWPSNITNITDE